MPAPLRIQKLRFNKTSFREMLLCSVLLTLFSLTLTPVAIAQSSETLQMRELYRNILQEQQTPYVWVRKSSSSSGIPERFYNSEGMVVLDISPTATAKLAFSDLGLRFAATFEGSSREIFIPIENIRALYARETGQGLSFDVASQARTDTNKDTLFTQGMIANDNGEAQLAFDLFSEACLKTGVSGCLMAGSYAESGRGVVPKDVDSAIRFYTQACEATSPVAVACSSLGKLILREKEDDPALKKLARNYLVRACELEDANGCSVAGVAFRNEEYGEIDLEKAMSLLRQGCDMGDEGGCKLVVALENQLASKEKKDAATANVGYLKSVQEKLKEIEENQRQIDVNLDRAQKLIKRAQKLNNNDQKKKQLALERQQLAQERQQLKLKGKRLEQELERLKEANSR